MDGKIALVTGGTSGIGKATAIGLAKQGAAVTLVVRSAQRGEQAARDIAEAVETARRGRTGSSSSAAAAPNAPKVELLECDLSSQASIRSAAMMFLGKHEKLHVLVNAAGVFVKNPTKTVDGIEQTFAVNYLAYFLLTNALLPALKKGAPSRVVNVSSRYGGAKLDFADLQLASKPYSYLKSTPPTMLARVMFTQEMAERLKGTGVVVNTLHPGLVAKTQLLNDTGGVFKWITDTFGGTPEKGADTAVWLASAPENANVTGKMFAKRKEVKTPGQAADPAARKRLWDETEKLTKMV